MKHSNATDIAVTLGGGHDVLTVTLQDNGIGFEYDSCVNHGLGLLSIQERAAGLGAQVTVDTAPGRGASLTLVVPVSPDHQLERTA